MRRLSSLLLALLALSALYGAGTASASLVVATNGIYNVDLESTTGQYTVTTGATHPLGPGLNVFYGSGTPGTSFDTVRSFTSSTDYKLPSLGEASTVTVPLGTTGFQTTYTIAKGESGAQDNLRVVQTIRVLGTTFNDSHVEVTTETTNTGGASVQIGTRYLWDYQVNKDDGPTFQTDEPLGPVLGTEAAFAAPTFNHYTITDNDVSPEPPTFDVIGSVTGPAGVAPVPPTLLQYAGWGASDSTDFEYAVNPAQSVATSAVGINDSAVLYYWGDTAADAPVLAPSQTYRASASIVLTPAGAGLPGTPPVVKILTGPLPETQDQNAIFTFKGVSGGVYECSIDNGAFVPCASGQNFGPLAPGDHLFQVRENLAGVIGPAAASRWTVALPEACVLRVARARVFVFTKKKKARLVIRYTAYKPANVIVSYKAIGTKGKLTLGKAQTKFKAAGVYRQTVSLKGKAFSTVKAAQSFKVHFKIPKTPKTCGAYYTKQLTIPQAVSGQTVWFQSDSTFAP